RGLIDAAEAERRRGALHTTAEFDAAGAADAAIEAVFEDVAVKAEVFDRLGRVMGKEALLASNTSYIDPAEFTAGVPGRDRVVGMHFFSPAHVMRLVEVVRTAQSSAESLATAFALARRLGKTPVLCGVCDGFIGNRILQAYGRLLTYMLEDGALPWEIDAAMRDFGWPMGFFEMVDLAGHQIGYARRQRLAAKRDPKMRYSRIPDMVFEAGREGQRNGRGWYRYAEGDRTPQPDPEVAALIEAESARLGITRRPIGAGEIQAGLLAVMANEGAAILAEGIAEKPRDIDVVEMLGFGYPRWRGGPMHAADAAGLDTVLAVMERIAEADPGSWRVSLLLRSVAEGGGFAGLNR
ncbi:MAG: 3-hydroxyacyl-CoA dehydrogenase, partial [Alphaproteobacteria bacterium]